MFIDFIYRLDVQIVNISWTNCNTDTCNTEIMNKESTDSAIERCRELSTCTT